MNIGTATYNGGRRFEYIKHLKKGDKLRCIKTTKSLGDIGASGLTFEYDEFIDGKVYPVDCITRWGGFHEIAYVVDEDGCSNFATPDLFELIIEWDTDVSNIGLPSNMYFGFGSEFSDIIYSFSYWKFRWSIFRVDKTYFVIKQKLFKGEWIEEWTKQMNNDLDEAKQFAENDFNNQEY